MLGWRMPKKRKGSVERNRNLKNAFEQLRELLQIPKVHRQQYSLRHALGNESVSKISYIHSLSGFIH